MKIPSWLPFQKKTQEHFFKYIVIGALTFLTDFVVLLVLIEFLGLATIIAVSFGYFTGVIVHFNLNRHWNFKNFDRKYHHQLITYIIATIVFYLLTVSFIEILIISGLHYAVAKIIVVGALGTFTFIFNRYITFNLGLKKFLKDIFN